MAFAAALVANLEDTLSFFGEQDVGIVIGDAQWSAGFGGSALDFEGMILPHPGI